MSATIPGEQSPASVASRLSGFVNLKSPGSIVRSEGPVPSATHVHVVLPPAALASFPRVLRDFCEPNGLRLVRHTRGPGAAGRSTLAWHDAAGHLQFLEVESIADRRGGGARRRLDPVGDSRRVIAAARRIIGQILRPPGLWVGFLGPDGCGKTTMIEQVARRWSGFFENTKRYHLRPHVGQNVSPGPLGIPPCRDRPRHPITSCLKLAYWWLDYAIGFAVGMLPSLARSSLVLFDRHYLDLLVDPVRYRYGGPMWLARLVGRGIPRPAVFLVLDTAPEVLDERKGELSRPEAAAQREAYRRLARDHERVHLVDVSGSVDAGAVACDRVLLDHLESRVLDRLGPSCAREVGVSRRGSAEGRGSG